MAVNPVPDRRHKCGDCSGSTRCHDADSGRAHRQRPGTYRSRLLDQRGNAVLELLLVLPIITFLTFGVIDYWVVLQKHQVAEHLMHKYLTRMQIDGGLSQGQEDKLTEELGKVGLVVEQVVGKNLESASQDRVIRNLDDPDEGVVKITITCRVDPAPLMTTKLVRGTPPGGDYRIKVGGEMISERVIADAW